MIILPKNGTLCTMHNALSGAGKVIFQRSAHRDNVEVIIRFIHHHPHDEAQ